MAEPMDGNQTLAGDQEQPTSEPSQGSGQLSQADIKALVSRTEELSKQVQDQTKLIAGLQKGTDKQIGQVRDNVKRILELQEQGLSATQIERELWIDQQMQDKGAPADLGPGRPQESAGFDVNAVVSKLGLDGNDPLVAAYKVAYQGSPKELLEKLTALTQPTAPSSPANAPLPEGGNVPPANKDVDALTSDYIKKVRAARGKPEEIRRLREQAIKDGVKTWEIDFS